jgi:hypothetical protein
MTAAARKLRVVPVEPPTVDLYANWRAEIRARDWAGMHIAADRRSPVEIADVRRVRRG